MKIHNTKNSKLVINVDDFGPDVEANDRTFNAYRQGKISSTSAFANMPWPKGTLEKLYTSHIPVGIHLNFTSGNSILPHSQIPTLTNSDGSFRLKNKSINLSHICPKELEAEFQAQLTRMDDYKLNIHHIDCHRHEIYFEDKLFQICLRIGKEREVRIRNPLPTVTEDYLATTCKVLGVDLDSSKKLANIYRSSCLSLGVDYIDYFINDTFSCGFETYFKNMLAKRQPSCRTELCIHFYGQLGRKKYNWITQQDFLNT